MVLAFWSIWPYFLVYILVTCLVDCDFHSLLCSHYWVALKQSTKPGNHLSGANLCRAAVINVTNCVNTKQTGDTEHMCCVNYWLNELQPTDGSHLLFSRLLLINLGGGSCWRMVKKTSLLFFFSYAQLLTRAANVFYECNKSAAPVSGRQLLFEVSLLHLSS